MHYQKLHYSLINNNKQKVLFLHGWGGNTFAFLDIAKRSHCSAIIPDLYGFGKTKEPNYIMDIFDYATQVYLFLKSKNIKECAIVAHSFGGRIAIILASMFDITITKLVLVDSAGIKPKLSIKTKIKIMSYKLNKWLVKVCLKNKKSLQRYGSSDYVGLSDIMKKCFVRIVNQDLSFLLCKIHCPTLIVWGQNDNVTPLYMAKQLNNGINNSGLVMYKNSGHFSYLENKNNFVQVLNSFFKE